ncbi:MFS transporter [Bacillus mycoides]|uniref:MFS transporter n=2 Tax=Bacillus cereus group TaxID=86661 RepID=UPI0036E7F6BD
MDHKNHNYYKIWVLLFIGWTVSYADRTITGPILTWMIENNVSFLKNVTDPHALAGLIGSLLFTGYMLTQFPGGTLGDKYGHSTIIIISVFWAGIVTILSGFVTTLVGFILLRVLVGLGEGVYYSNDRCVVIENTPVEKRSLGLGVVIAGLSVGITLGTILVPVLINFGKDFLGNEDAWRMPFFIFGFLTLLVGIMFLLFLKNHKKAQYLKASMELFLYSFLSLSVIMAIYYLSTKISLPKWGVAVLELILAIIVIFIVFRKGYKRFPEVLNKNLIIMYVSAISILWNLWFFGFWSVAIISSAADTTFMKATLTAAFNAGAGVIGFPMGGWISDFVVKKGGSRKTLLVVLTLLQGILTFVFGIYILYNGNSMVIMGLILFITSLTFNALQPVSHALTAELVIPKYKGTAFGLWNLVGEIGAVLSPVINGTLRDLSGNWVWPIMLDAVLIIFSFFLLLFINIKKSTYN